MLLEKIVDGIDDITEPECMDRVLMYLEEIQAEDEAFMTTLTTNLCDRMDITWQQPWYQKSRCLTRPLVAKEKSEVLGETFLTHAFSKKESDKVHKNWKKFVKKYNIPNTPICFARWKNKDKSRNPNNPEEQTRHFVTAYLARGLERNLYQVYKHILSYYGGPQRGSYSDLEKKIMDICFYHCPKNAVIYLSTVLSREPRGIYKKFQQMNDYDDKVLVKKQIKKWTLPLATNFFKLLMKYSESSLEQLKYKRISKDVWLKLQNDMDYYYVYLQRFWYLYLHTQLFVTYDVRMKRLRKKLFTLIKLYPYQIWSDIQWTVILKHFPSGFTHHFLYNAAQRIAKRYPKYRHVPLNTVADYCLEKNKKSSSLIRLKTLVLNKDGNLEKIIYDKKMPVKTFDQS